MPKISIILASERIDKIYPAIILATSSVAMGWDAEIFFTFWGLLALKKGYETKNVSLDYNEYKESLIKMIELGKIPEWKNMIKSFKNTGKLKIYACSTTMELLGINKGNLEDFVDNIVGAPT
ncbi:MAG: DsrE/DsrF/DrsH-like family protein, partial [Candidatus Aenigmatarchaeota archaeon]